MVCVELTNPVQNLEIDSEDWDIIVQRWSLMPSLTLSDSMLIRCMMTSFITHQDIFILQLLPGHLKCRNGRGWSYQPAFIQRTPVYLSHNWLFLQMGWSYPLEGGKDKVKTSDVIKFIKHHVVNRFGVPRRIIHDNGPQFVSQAFLRFCNKSRI